MTDQKMPAKKPASKKLTKAQSSKRAKAASHVFPLDLPDKRSVSKRSPKRNGAQLVRVWGGDDYKPGDKIVAGVMPNPWPPDDIVRLLTIACSAYGGVKLAKLVFETIKLWLDLRKARKVRIKKGEYEIEIHAGMSAREIEKVIDLLVRKTKELEGEEPKIVLPPGIDRSIPTQKPSRKA